MGYQVDHTLSVEQNLINLANTRYRSPAGFPLVSGDFTWGIPEATEPDPLDGSNTRLELLAGTAGSLVGTAIVKYRRFNLAENRPSAGTSLHMSGDLSTEAIKARILQVQRVVGSEVEWLEPEAPPAPGQSAVYTLVAIEDSTIYSPGSLEITVFNDNEPVA